jgi:hypothetical protein
MKQAPLIALSLAAPALAGPDLILAGIPQVVRWGERGGVHAYSFGVVACNIGDADLDWFANTNRHPVLASQMYRLADGRFEQIGLGWARHEFFPLQMGYCGVCTLPSSPPRLGSGCSTTESASIGGQQSLLGPRTEIDPASGAFPYPFATINTTGDALYKRLQARESDLALPGARFVFEGLYVAPDDATAGHGANNAAWREATINPSTFEAALIGLTAREEPAIFAWQQSDPGVLLTTAIAPDGGRYWVGSRATELESGLWAYEYAVLNLNSGLPAGRVAVPGDGASVSAIGFHDVDHHSGEAIDGADWTVAAGAGAIAWEAPAPPPGLMPNSIRWGTLYNFRFVAGTQSVHAEMTIDLDGGGTLALGIVAPDAPACSPADLVSPFGVLDLLDVQAFIAGFVGSDPVADLAEPFGVFDLADVQAFTTAFGAGCD